MKIGVFDSGVGGKSFIAAIETRFPTATIVYKEDKGHLPYGDKSIKQLLEFTVPIFKQFEIEQCDVVLVACNTVTTTIINMLRKIVATPLVGVEPMIKPAALKTKSGVITICATPATLASDRYKELKRLYAPGVVVLEPDCSDWARMIEDNREDELDLNKLVTESILQGSDTLLLACTHYHWIEQRLKKIAGDKMQVMQPIEPVLNQLERILRSTGSLDQ